MKDGLRFFAISSQVEKRVFLFLACGIAASVPLKPSYNSLFCISLLAFWILFMKKKFEEPKIKIIFMISALCLIALAGMIYTQNVDEGWFRLQQKSLLLVLPLIFGTISFDWQKEFKWIVSIFVVSILLACVVCFAEAFRYWIQYQSNERFFDHGLVEFINMYPYVMALLCLMCILIMTEALLGKYELHSWLHQRSLVIALIIFLSIFILLLSVKQIILAWIIFFIFYSFRTHKKKSVVLIMIVTCFLLITGSVMIIPTLKTKFYEVVNGKDNTIPLDQDSSLGRNWNGIALRKAIWICAVDAIGNNPLMGVGTGDGQDVLQATYENRQFYFASRYNRYNAHNQYLQVLLNYGIIGLMIWLGSLFWLLRNFKTDFLVVSLLACLMFAMLTESMFETNKGVLLMAFTITIFSFGQPSSWINKNNSAHGNER
jgi:O-antigen ligase